LILNPCLTETLHMFSVMVPITCTVGQLTLITVFLLSTVFFAALFIAQSRKQKKEKH